MVDEKKTEVGILDPFYRLRHEGLVDFDKLFNEITSWFESNKYKLIIKNLTNSMKPDGGEIKVEFEAKREVSPYIKFKAYCEIILLRGREVTVEKSGKKQRMRKGELEIRIKTSYEKNHKGTFGKGNFQEFLRQVYEKYIAKNVILGYEIKLWKEGNELIEVIKEVLESFK